MTVSELIIQPYCVSTPEHCSLMYNNMVNKTPKSTKNQHGQYRMNSLFVNMYTSCSNNGHTPFPVENALDFYFSVKKTL